MRMPGSVSHGTYICYYKNGTLHETRWSGKATQRKVFDRPAIGGDCVFDPPKKATYFQISAIGGGGGGGDAGYNGGSLVAKLDSHTELPPLLIDEARADAYGLRDKDPSAADPYADAKAATGTLWSFAKSLPSGAGGDVGYMVNDGPYDGPCIDTEEYCSEYASNYSDAVRYDCWIEEEDEEEGDATLVRKIIAKLKSVNRMIARVKGMITGAATTITDCGYYWTYKQEHSHIEQQLDYIEDKPYTCCPGGYSTVTVTEGHYDTVTVDCSYQEWVSFGGGGGEPGAAQGSSAGGTYVTHPCSKQETVWVPAVTKQECIGGESTCYQHIKHYKDVTVSDPTTSETASHISSSCDSSKIKCEVSESSSGAPCVETSERCIEWEQYKDRFSHTTASGGAGGSGATCSTNGVTHKLLNLDYKGDRTAIGSVMQGEGKDLTGSGPGGLPYQSPEQGGYGGAACQGYVSNTASGCGNLKNAAFSQSTITDNGAAHTTIAYSAWKGGAGASRILTGPYPTPPQADMYWNDAGPTPASGEDGGCDPAYESGGLGDCGSDAMIGYCLRHKKMGGGTIDEPGPGAAYDYKRIFDTNFLTKGNPGYAGEFHTVIVRSLDSVDRTIHIGRGGSPATLNLGGSGADGSPTYMGATPESAIIKAEGGKGGEGYQYAIFPTQLPRFDKKRWKAERLCYKKLKGTTLTAAETSEMNTYLSSSGLGSCPTKLEDYKFVEDSGAELGGTPSTVTFGGMFNFMKLSFNADSVIDSLMKHAGKGGTGGGVTHSCWAGQDKIWLNEIWDDNAYLKGPSVTREEITPTGCFADFENHVAGPGTDGAIIIRW